MKLLITGASVFDGDMLTPADVLVADGYIEAVGKGLQAEDAEVFNAEGCIVSPGFTDLHVHLREPGFEAKETIATGTLAAAAGGFTTVCPMPNLNPVPDTYETLYPQWTLIEKEAQVCVMPYGALTMGECGEQVADIQGMAPFVSGFSDDGRGVQSEELMRKAMEEAAKCGHVVAAHCEVDALIDSGAVCVQEGSTIARENNFRGYTNDIEWREIERDIRLCEETGCKLHICHISTRESVDLVRKAKEKGLPVTCEVAPHHLVLTCEDIKTADPWMKMNPPLRLPQDREALIEAVYDGTIDAIATDHAPHTAEEKSRPFAQSPCGVVGFETAFAACYTQLVLHGKLSVEQLLQMFTWRPRSIICQPRQYIAPGEVADLVVLDTCTEREVKTSMFCGMGKATAFLNRRFFGWPMLTVYQDKIVYRRP